MSGSKKEYLDIDQNLPTKDGKGGFSFLFKLQHQKRWLSWPSDIFLKLPKKKAVKVAKLAIRHFSQTAQKKAVKVAKLAIRHFSKLPQKKPEKVAKPAFRHFFPSCPKKGGKAGETGFTAFTAFFLASFEKSLSTKKNRLYRFYRLFFARVKKISLFFFCVLSR